MNIKVKFSTVDEFLEELKKDLNTGSIHRNIIRVTGESIPSAVTPMIRLLSIVATYRRDDEVIELHRFCGDHWVGMKTEGNDKTQESYGALLEAVKEPCAKLGLEVRAGKYERMNGP